MPNCEVSLTCVICIVEILPAACAASNAANQLAYDPVNELCAISIEVVPAIDALFGII